MNLDTEIEKIVTTIAFFCDGRVATQRDLLRMANKLLVLKASFNDESIAIKLLEKYIRQENHEAVENTLQNVFSCSSALHDIKNLFDAELNKPLPPTPPPPEVQSIFSILQSLHDRTSMLESKMQL
jgi:hypothetical protein